MTRILYLKINKRFPISYFFFIFSSSTVPSELLPIVVAPDIICATPILPDHRLNDNPKKINEGLLYR